MTLVPAAAKAAISVRGGSGADRYGAVASAQGAAQVQLSISGSHSGAVVFSISRNRSSTGPSEFGVVTFVFSGASILYLLLIASSRVSVSSNLSNNCNEIKHSVLARLF